MAFLGGAAQILRVTGTVGATATAITHGLGVVPDAVFISPINAAANAVNLTTAPTNTTITAISANAGTVCTFWCLVLNPY